MVTFLVGQRYRNRKGEYEVLEVQGSSMKVRYDNGIEQVLSIPTQARILENMQYGEVLAQSPRPKLPRRFITKPQGHSFYWSIGFLLARNPRLIPIVPPKALDTFRDDYHDATGRELSCEEEKASVFPSIGKHWSELRVTFKAESSELHLLDFGYGITIRKGSGRNSWNINRNPFYLRLLELNFSRGSQQDKASIEGAIPSPFLGAFRKGYSRGLGANLKGDTQ